VAEPKFASASLVDNVRFNQTVIVPNALQGIFRRRPTAVGLATRANVDGQAVGLLRGLRRKHDGRPVWVRVVKDPALLLLQVDDVQRALEGSPEPFAADPPGKKRGMAAFQPDALTISRGPLWRARRTFAEGVLDDHGLDERFLAIVDEELSGLAGTLDLDVLQARYRRITRRVVLGDAAADDEQLSDELAELMEQANGMPAARKDPYDVFAARVAAYVEAGQDGSLAGRAAAQQAEPDVRVAGQLTHWLFALGDTLSTNALRTLALACAHPGEAQDLRATLLEAMRLWPTTAMLARETTGTLVWDGVRVDAGTQVLIVNAFFHRDRERLGERADRFSPEAWAPGGAFVEDWGLNFFSHGPQGCPGADLSLLIGEATLRALLAREPVLEHPRLDSAKPLPHMLNPYALRFTLKR
jgi:cytochrome P450